MRTQPIDSDTARDANFVRLRRTGGIAGVDERVEVEMATGSFRVRQRAFLSEPQEFELDSVRAAELVQLAEQLAERSASSHASRRGADLYQYELEVGWRGERFRFVVTGAPSDSAVHGMIVLVAGLLNQGPDHPHQLTGHVVAD